MWDGVYAGATAGKHIRNAMIYAAIAFVMSYLATYLYLDVVSIYIAYFAHLIARVLYLTFSWKKVQQMPWHTYTKVYQIYTNNQGTAVAVPFII